MVHFFKNLFVKYLKKKFFNKILLTYTSIVLVALIALAIIVSNSVSKMVYNNELVYNKLILGDLSDYFDNKRKVLFSTVDRIYNDHYVNQFNANFDAADFIEQNDDKLSEEYINFKPKFDNYIMSFFSQDADILNIMIYKNSDHQIYLYSRNINSNINEDDSTYLQRLNQIRGSNSNPFVLPAFKPSYMNEQHMVYTISMPIKRLNSNDKIGFLIIDFSTSGIDNYLSKYASNVKSDFLILSKSQEVIYDSSHQFYEQKFPYWNLLTRSTNSIKINRIDSMVNLDTDNKSDVMVVGTTPKSSIFKQVDYTKRTIYLVAFLCILVVILISYATTNIFSKRIGQLIKKMNRVWIGDLTARIPVNRAEDEIGEIAVNFNKMCDNLNNYINQVYVSGIKQKNAELTALQAQVNPHFLYNTLEAIRMNAIAKEDQETSEMIYILSKLFRNSIKGETIVYINDELENAQMYLKLFKIRYGDRLAVHFDIDEEILSYGIVKHLIQPILENYIIHGYDGNQDDNTIYIKGNKNGADIVFFISDNGRGLDAKRLTEIQKSLESYDLSAIDGSIGLANINERIKIIFGTHCGVDIYSDGAKGTSVTVTILAKTKEELKEHVQSVTS